jgi:hypothetical protein
MIYTARTPTQVLKPTAPFLSRGLNFAPAKISDLEIFAKPDRVQLAYGDYEKNIGAFVFATATRAKVFIGMRSYVFPHAYVPSIPIPLPPTIFALEGTKQLATKAKEQVNKAMEKMEGESRDLGGRAGTVWLINKPIFSAIRSSLPGIASPRIPFVAGYCSSHASFAATTILQFIDAFLATHTYEYKGEHITDDHQTHTVSSKRKHGDTQLPKKKRTVCWLIILLSVTNCIPEETCGG